LRYVTPTGPHTSHVAGQSKSYPTTQDIQLEQKINGVGKTWLESVPQINWTAPIPAPRHQDLYPDLKLPFQRIPSMSSTDQTNLYWLRRLATNQSGKQDFSLIDGTVPRVLTLWSGDEIVGQTFKQLEESGEIDNAIVIYTTDNGFHLGAHGKHYSV